ncbi:MAG: UDP-3-O-(3-hydroxymyristoyl)glucosamine N-acyltransferase [Planctomycetes bacterium]|nr:UDP-3-O-(3-hydroxymyristoyl)glucosamine N-acyltransferase [Planctomycetota bacterium]
MNHTVGSLAQIVHGEVLGSQTRLILDANSIEAAGSDAITFIQDEKHTSRLADSQAGCVLVNPKVAKSLTSTDSRSLIVVDDPQAAFIEILPKFRRVRGRPPREISARASIDSTAKLGDDCYVGPGVAIAEDVQIGNNCDIHSGVVIGPGCRLGDNVILYPNVVLYHDVTVGDRSIIHSGAVIGADGFGYRFVSGRFEKIPQLGTVEIHSDVEIGACTTIDRGAIGATIIGAGTKLDNLIMIGHNCEIGQHNVFASQVGLAGSCSTGDYVRMGGQVGVKDHVRMNSGSIIGAKSGVHKDIPANEFWVGYPATPEGEQKTLVFSLKRVPEMRNQVKTLEKQVATLIAQMAEMQSQRSEELRKAG